MGSTLLKGHLEPLSSASHPLFGWKLPCWENVRVAVMSDVPKWEWEGESLCMALLSPHLAEVTLKQTKNLKKGWRRLFWPRLPAHSAARCMGCSTQEPARWKNYCPMWYSSSFPSESCSKLPSYFLLVFSAHQLSKCSYHPNTNHLPSFLTQHICVHSPDIKVGMQVQIKVSYSVTPAT